MKPELKLVENTGSQLEADAEALVAELPPQQTEMPASRTCAMVWRRSS